MANLFNISRPLRDDEFTIDLTNAKREVFQYYVMKYFVVIPTKTYTYLISTSYLSINDKTAAKKAIISR